MFKSYTQISCRILRRFFWFFLIACSLIVFDIGITGAQQNDLIDEQGMVTSASEGKQVVGIEKKKEQAQAWLPAPPPPDDFDWIQLTSGEWLKGEFKALYKKELEFDSDELDLLKLDWEDVKQVRGHQVFSVRFEGPITVIGVIQVTEDKVYVATDEGRQEFERNQLIAIAPGEPKEINYWSAKISIGLNLYEGNTDQLQFNSKWNVMRRTSVTRLVLDYLGNYTTTNNVETVENQRLTGNFDIMLTRNYYIRAVFAEYYRDPFQNIDGRVTLGAGVGYHIIDTSKIEWDITAGPAYQYTKFASVEPWEDSSASTPVLSAGTNYDIELTEKIDFIINYSFNIVNEESGSYTHHAIATLETEVTDILDFDISFVWDRTEKPTARADGTIPEKDNFQLIFWVGVDF